MSSVSGLRTAQPKALQFPQGTGSQQKQRAVHSQCLQRGLTGRSLRTRQLSLTHVHRQLHTARDRAPSKGRISGSDPLICKAMGGASSGCSGTVGVHLFQDCRSSPIFGNFQEGLLHVLEVERGHPHYQTALVFETLSDPDSEGQYSQDWAYSTFTLYDASEPFAPLPEAEAATEFGVPGPHNLLLTSEVGCYPSTATSPLAAGSAASVGESDVVAIAAFDQTERSLEEWPQWSGAAELAAQHPSLRSACLYRVDSTLPDAGAAATGWKYVLQVQFASLMEEGSTEDLAAIRQVLADANAGVCEVYRSLFAAPKGGSPVGVLAGDKAAKDAAKIQKAMEETS